MRIVQRRYEGDRWDGALLTWMWYRIPYRRGFIFAVCLFGFLLKLTKFDGHWFVEKRHIQL